MNITSRFHTKPQLTRLSAVLELAKFAPDSDNANPVTKARLHYTCELFRDFRFGQIVQLAESSAGQSSGGDNVNETTNPKPKNQVLKFYPGGGETVRETPKIPKLDKDGVVVQGSFLTWVLTDDVVVPSPAKVNMWRNVRVYEIYTGYKPVPADFLGGDPEIA